MPTNILESLVRNNDYSTLTTPASTAEEDAVDAEDQSEETTLPENLPSGAKTVIALLKNGLIHGTYVPSELPPSKEARLTPDQLVNLGIGVYLPKDPKVKLVLYDPLKVTERMLKRLDERKKIPEVFPPVTKWLKAEAEDEETANAEAPAETDQTAAPSGEPTTVSVLPPIMNTPKQRARRQVRLPTPKLEPPLSGLM